MTRMYPTIQSRLWLWTFTNSFADISSTEQYTIRSFFTIHDDMSPNHDMLHARFWARFTFFRTCSDLLRSDIWLARYCSFFSSYFIFCRYSPYHYVSELLNKHAHTTTTTPTITVTAHKKCARLYVTVCVNKFRIENSIIQATLLIFVSLEFLVLPKRMRRERNERKKN